MKKSVINIKTNEHTKREAKKVASELGLSLSSVINTYLLQFIRTKEIHLSAAPKISRELETLLGGIEHDIVRGRRLSHKVSSDKELRKHLASL